MTEALMTKENELQEAAKQLRSSLPGSDGIVGIGYGLRKDGQHVIRVNIATAEVATKNSIPDEFMGFPIEKRVVGKIIAR